MYTDPKSRSHPHLSEQHRPGFKDFVSLVIIRYYILITLHRQFLLVEISLMAAETRRKAIIVGISGASSSGKTTLARLLRDVFPHTFVLHEDDFYRPETE